jgi:xanthine/uracil/vitamin C permease (AzgA family)
MDFTRLGLAGTMLVCTSKVDKTVFGSKFAAALCVFTISFTVCIKEQISANFWWDKATSV